MAFKATALPAAIAFEQIRRQAAESKRYLQSARASLTLATVQATNVLAVVQHVVDVVARLDGLATTPGLAQYARDQYADQAYDVAAEYASMRAAMVSARDNLVAMFPKDGSGFLLYQQFGAGGALAIRTFTAAQVAPAVALIDAVIATIE